MRFAVDIGGTFSDLVVEHDDATLRLYKSPTTPEDPTESLIATLEQAADDAGIHRYTVLAKAHQADIGNSVPTTYFAAARDVYEEGRSHLSRRHGAGGLPGHR